MKASELIKRLEEIVKENGDVDIHRYDDEFNYRYEIDGIRNVKVRKRVLVAGTVWPNDKYEFVDDYSYWEIW
jgi:hypothetical protein